MASKIHGHTFYVAITPYKVDGSSADEFNELSVRASYDSSRKHFYVDLHAGWKSDFGHGCIMMGPDDPLQGPKYVVVKSAPKNSQKTIDEMGASLELAKDAIAWLFDKRDWNRLYAAVRNIALNGYTEQYRQQMEALMADAKGERGSGTSAPQTEPIVKQVDVIGMMDALSRTGSVRLSDFATPVDVEKPQASPLEQKWREQKEKHPEKVLLFRCGDFYETYFEDADVCAEVLGITLTKRNTDGSHMAGFPYHALDTYLPKLVRAGKRVAICDEININQNKEDQDMRLNINNNQNETKNVQAAAQVNNAGIEDAEIVNVGEVSVDDIVPMVVMAEEPKPEAPTEADVATAVGEAASEGKATTMPLGTHGSLVIASGGGEKNKPAEKNVTLKRKQTEPEPEAVGELAGMLTKVRLVTFTTKRGDTAPRIVGFSGEDDPRWKPVYEEKQKLVDAYNKAKSKDPKAKLVSSPFGPAWLTDRETGDKSYCMTFGTRYMDVAKALCDAYNTTDREAWKRAEQAVTDCKNGIVAGYQAEKAARQAERAAKREAKKNVEPATDAISSEEREMFDLFKKFMKGDKEAMAKVGAVLKKAA